MLGVCLAPDGNVEVEYQHLVEVAQQWQLSMAAAKVTHLVAKLAHAK